MKRRPITGEFPGNPNLPNGITIFPGGFPLYRKSELIGAIGVSGDGVDQDDIIAASGCEDFLADPNIRADTFAYQGFRLPYAKFPRNPVITAKSVVRRASALATPSATTNARDLDRDGAADLIFQNNAGQLYTWNMDGAGATISGGYLYGGGLGDWSLKAVADINNDGIGDLIFQNGVGQIYVWYLDGTGSGVDFPTGSGLKPGSHFLYGGALGDWKVIGAADINNDGNTDLVFQNGIGQIYIWYLDGSGSGVDFSTGSGLKAGSNFLYSAGLGDWRLKAIGDINGDGNADLLFQNSAGQLIAWFLDDSGAFHSLGWIYTGGLGDWKVTSVADMNGDGYADLVFQNGIGQIAVWYLDGSGATVDFSAGTGFVPPGSQVIYPNGLGDWRLR